MDLDLAAELLATMRAAAVHPLPSAAAGPGVASHNIGTQHPELEPAVTEDVAMDTELLEGAANLQDLAGCDVNRQAGQGTQLFAATCYEFPHAYATYHTWQPW